MRSVTVRLTCGDHPVRIVPSAEGERRGFSRGPLHQIELLDDGSVVALRSVAGDLAAYRDLVADHEDVHEALTSADRDGFLYAHFEPSAATRRLLSRFEADTN